MKEQQTIREAGSKLLERFFFPLILILFPLVKASYGIDLTDTGYSLGNYRFFGTEGGVWTLLTFLSGGMGNFLMKLPMGNTMLGMKIYTGLLVSLTALTGYRFFRTKMPAWLAFAGEVAAIGLCWCPTVILYNYLTYFLFLLGCVFLFRGLAGCRNGCLVLAGICLGLNAFSRFPGNVLEAALILALWYYGALKGKKTQKILIETGLCAAGYAAAFAVAAVTASVWHGGNVFSEMIQGVLGMAGSASDYTFGEMLYAILDAYGHGLRWMLYMLLCILPGIPFLVLFPGKLEKARKIVYCLCIPLLFLALEKWGMFHFRYYQKEAALQWGAVFLLLGIGALLWLLFTRQMDDEWRLIGAIALIVILITPLGSNNHIWPALNNLFFAAPVVFWILYRFIRWGRKCLDATGKVPLFPAKAMFAGMLLMFFVQAAGVGFGYVFLDGETGEDRSYKVEGNSVLAGMHTTAQNGENLEEISAFMTENKDRYEEKKLLLYGNIPGLCYYLDKPSAVYTSWADLDTNPLGRLEEELKTLTGRPLVIITPQLAAYFSGDRKAMEYWGTDIEGCKGDQKLSAILQFMREQDYRQVFANEAFAIYE